MIAEPIMPKKIGDHIYSWISTGNGGTVALVVVLQRGSVGTSVELVARGLAESLLTRFYYRPIRCSEHEAPDLDKRLNIEHIARMQCRFGTCRTAIIQKAY